MCDGGKPSSFYAQSITLDVMHVLLFNPDDSAAASPDLGDMSPEGPQPPVILLQQLLASATQPSPVKAIFDRQELEVLSVSFAVSVWCRVFSEQLRLVT